MDIAIGFWTGVFGIVLLLELCMPQLIDRKRKSVDIQTLSCKKHFQLREEKGGQWEKSTGNSKIQTP